MDIIIVIVPTQIISGDVEAIIIIIPPSQDFSGNSRDGEHHNEAQSQQA